MILNIFLLSIAQKTDKNTDVVDADLELLVAYFLQIEVQCLYKEEKGVSYIAYAYVSQIDFDF